MAEHCYLVASAFGDLVMDENARLMPIQRLSLSPVLEFNMYMQGEWTGSRKEKEWDWHVGSASRPLSGKTP